MSRTAVLKLSRSCLRAEIRSGRLRVSKPGKRYYFLGEWLIEWIRAGERKPHRRRHAGEAPGDDGAICTAHEEREACARLAERMGAAEVAAAIRAGEHTRAGATADGPEGKKPRKGK